jgi:hypothetical protein
MSDESQVDYEEEEEQESGQDPEDGSRPGQGARCKDYQAREVFMILKRMDKKFKGCFSDFILPPQLMTSMLHADTGPPGDFTDMATMDVGNSTFSVGLTTLQTAAHFLLRSLETIALAPERTSFRGEKDGRQRQCPQ